MAQQPRTRYPAPQSEPIMTTADMPADQEPTYQEPTAAQPAQRVPPGVKTREMVAKDKLATQEAARAEQLAKADDRTTWRPTPTQEENDLVAMGVPVDKVGHRDDGSPPDPHAQPAAAPAQTQNRGYETR